MCLKGLTSCFSSIPDYERSPDRHREQHEKHREGSWSSPKPPESSDIPGKPQEFGASNERVDSYSTPRVMEGKHESPKRAPQVSTSADKGNSHSPPRVNNRGVDPSRSPVKRENGLVSKYEPQHIPKETRAPAKASDGSERPNQDQGLVWRE